MFDLANWEAVEAREPHVQHVLGEEVGQPLGMNKKLVMGISNRFCLRAFSSCLPVVSNPLQNQFPRNILLKKELPCPSNSSFQFFEYFQAAKHAAPQIIALPAMANFVPIDSPK